MNFAQLIDPHPADAPAVVSRRETTTYGTLRTQVAALSGSLRRLGLDEGDRVAVVAANNWYFVVGYLAALHAGMVAVPLNPGSPPPELARQLAGVGARAALFGPSARRHVGRIDPAEVPALEHRIVAGAADGEAVPLEALLDGGPAEPVDRADDDLAVLLYTSGTVGAPRAAMLTHGNLRAAVTAVARHPGREQRPDDVVLGVLPLYHVFGLSIVCNLTLAAGATMVLVERFDPATAMETIQHHGVTVIPGAPPMWTAWAHLPEVNPDAFATVRVAVSGAAHLPEETWRLARERLGVDIAQGYGLTETTATVTTSLGLPHRPGSIGVPLPGVEVRLVDADGTDALVGDAGEIWVRGPNVFRGYWNDAEATRAAFSADGWLRTGDVAVADDEGLLYLVDRVKELIIVSGFNVYPAEVEEVLATHPAVRQVAVVGVPHPHTGEAVKALVVAEPGSHVDEDELIDWAADRLARYKCPTKVMFVDELPTGVAGKVVRRQLQAD